MSSFMRHGFGIIVGDDGTFFAGTFHRDMLQGHGAVFKDGAMLYADFQKGTIQGLAVAKFGDVRGGGKGSVFICFQLVYCGTLANSRPTSHGYTYRHSTATWSSLDGERGQQCYLSWPSIPSFVDERSKALMRRVVSFEFNFSDNSSPSYGYFGILHPPPAYLQSTPRPSSQLHVGSE